MEEFVNQDSGVNNTAQPAVIPMDEEGGGGISIMDILMRCMGNWYWFLICATMALAIAVLYVKKQEKVYSRSATILVKEENSSAANKMGVQEDMGVFKSTSTVANEIIAMQSPQVITEVAKRLKLNMYYSTEGRFHKETLYGWNLPVEVVFLDVKSNEWAGGDLELHKDGTYKFYNIFGMKGSFSETVSGKLNEEVKTPLGMMKVLPSSSYQPKEMDINVVKTTAESAAAGYTGKLSIAQRGDKSSVIDLYFVDVSTQRAEDFLNMLITVYSEFWVNDRNQIAQSTNAFINDRLAVIERELGTVETNISNFKSENLLPDINSTVSRSMGEVAAATEQILDLNNQLSMAQFLLEFVQNRDNSNKLIPSVSGIGSSNVESLISGYNTLVLERMQLVNNSSEVNPLVQETDEQIATMHDVIESSVRNQILALETQLKSQKKKESRATNEIVKNPNQAKYLLSVERQQQVKQSLYTYLLQKREENELSQAFTAYNTRILNPPSGSSTPIAPVAQNIYMIALAIGLGLPLAFIVLLEVLNTTVRGRKDLETMRTPFLGEVPFVQTENLSFWERLFAARNLKSWAKNDPFVSRILMKLGMYRKDDKESDKKLKLFVKPGNRNQINEAFRVVRSNMEFMKTGHDKQVIMITSANAASGKTFITINLGASFAVKGKKVLVVDMDFRKRSLSKYVQKPKKGLTDYLAGRENSYQNLIVREYSMENLDVLPVGSIPPNPTELLYEESLGTMLGELRRQYDLILLDCPPIEIVADSSIIAQHADETIFLVRAGLLQRSMLPEIDKFYANKKFGNMAILLNGTDDSYGKYGYSKYGYRYGYHYGYGGHYYSEGN